MATSSTKLKSIMRTFKIEKPYYPIVYVRGYAMTPSEREDTFHDTYYGFSANSVEKRQAPPPDYFKADVFEGQLIRFMKLKDYGYADAANSGEKFHNNPSRSLWVSRFYDDDFMKEKLRSIEAHAEDLRKLICEQIPARLKSCNVQLGTGDKEYKVILIAHSMGGLVCRTLIQNLLQRDAKRWVHRLVTIGSPHKGINLGRIPDFLENFVSEHLNPFDANIFQEKRMREYLKLKKTEEVHSLGSSNFPVKRCFCLIGSDYESYSAVQRVTGNFSDGLVKQDRAYIVCGSTPAKGKKYSKEQMAFWANIHRAHSGRRGIVNSYESFENIQRFLFGNIKAEMRLENLAINTPQLDDHEYFYDIEFKLSIRGTNTYLHRRQQDPCENAIRIPREKIGAGIYLHTAFMNSELKTEEDGFSYFSMQIRILERSVKKGFLWDHEYPDKQIYSETLEIKVGDSNPANPGDELEFRWLSDVKDWAEAKDEGNKLEGIYHIPLRKAGSVDGKLVISAGLWPDASAGDD